MSNENQILITGSVSDNNKKEEEIEIYSSMVGLNKDSYHNFAVFEYHKSHLVPFGEYMPLRKIIPFKKITHGLVDYTPGKKESIYLQKFNLNILPLICYESIFPNEVIASNKNADIIINITNDAWYGNSSGPYQHFQISKMRTIENGLPMIRASNNGISAFIDPLGRVLKQTKLNDITIIDSFIPKKLSKETCFFKYGFSLMWGAIFLVLILQLLIKYIVFFVYN